jgi:hypothetical protein
MYGNGTFQPENVSGATAKHQSKDVFLFCSCLLFSVCLLINIFQSQFLPPIPHSIGLVNTSLATKAKIHSQPIKSAARRRLVANPANVDWAILFTSSTTE